MSTLTQTELSDSSILPHISSEDWFEQDGRGEIYVRYYSIPFNLKDGFNIPGLNGTVIEYSNSPFRVIVARISQQKYRTHVPWLVNSEVDVNQVLIEQLDRELPEMNYVIISTPIKGAEHNAYNAASLRMDSFAGALRLIGGNNLLRELVREAAVDVKSGNMKTPTKLTPIPASIEGPFATNDSLMQHKELADAIAGAETLVRARITLATQLVERAFLSNGTSKFMNYWVALEVAANTHSSRKIITLLSRHYGESNAHIQNYLGFASIWKIRTALFHRGELYELPSDVERYIQCLFLDVLRASLGLSPQRHMAEMVEAGFSMERMDKDLIGANILTIV